VTTAGAILNLGYKGNANALVQVDTNHFICFSYDMSIFKGYVGTVVVNTST